jgi:sn-glycerol 3-phosphate transport system permease protein
MKLSTLLTRVVMAVAIAVVSVPLLYMVGTALRPEASVFADALQPLPPNPTLENFVTAATTMNYPHMLLVSIIFAGGVTLGQLCIAILAAYVFGCRRFPGDGWLFAIMLATIPIPFVVTYVPNYLLMARTHLLNTYLGLILPQVASAYGIFLLRQHFRAFPRSILEAAEIDGASHWRTLGRIVVPANLPVIFALSVYIFVNTWNQYIWPLLAMADPHMHTLTVGVQDFAMGEGGSHWGALMAGATLATLPTFIVFLFARRQILETLMEGAVKG